MAVSRPAAPWTLNTGSAQYTNLVHCWPGSADGSTYLEDLKGGVPLQLYYTGNDGPKAGTFGTMPTIGGSCATVADDGANKPQWRAVGNDLSIATTDAFTVSLWHVNTNDAGLNRAVVAFGQGGSNWTFKIRRNSGNPGAYYTAIVTTSGGAAGFDAQSTTTFANNELVHLAVTWAPGAGGLKLYCNGSLEDSDGTTTTTLRSEAATYGWAFPGEADEAYTSPGSYCDIRLYDAALSSTVIAAMAADSTAWELYTNSTTTPGHLLRTRQIGLSGLSL